MGGGTGDGVKSQSGPNSRWKITQKNRRGEERLDKTCDVDIRSIFVFRLVNSRARILGK